MQIIYDDASNINLTAQKRLLRVVQGQTQASPFAGTIDPSLRLANGHIRVPKSTDESGVATEGVTPPLTRSAEAFTLNGSLPPGLVLVKTAGENYAIAAGGKKERPAGLLGQWIGGSFDNIKQTNQIGVWQGLDSYYDLLAPGFNPTGLAAAVSENAKSGKPTYLQAGADGRLVLATSNPVVSVGVYAEDAEAFVPVAEVIDFSNTAVLRFRLLV